MTDSNYTHIAVLLDRSGSMENIKTDTEGGFKTFLDEQKAAPGRATIALSQFDSVYEVVYRPQDITLAADLKLVPRGSTALLDGMGRIITETGTYLAALDEDKRPSNVVVVIITDGEENASIEWTRDKVFAEITKQQNDYGWTFIFLASNQDAIAAGASFGVHAGTSMTYDSANVGQTYSTMSASVSRTRTGQDAAFTEEERKSSVTTP